MGTPYFYIIRHKPSGDRYAGSRWSKKAEPADLLKTYFTSSKTIHRLIERDGIDSFVIEFVNTDFAGRTALEYETDFLNKNFGEGWLNSHRNAGFNGKFGAGNAAFRRAMNIRWGVDFPAQNKEISEKTRAVWEEKYGGHPNQRAESRRKASETLKSQYAECKKENPMKSDSAKAAISSSSKANRLADPVVKCPHCGKEGKGPPMARWHFDRCKEK